MLHFTRPSIAAEGLQTNLRRTSNWAFLAVGVALLLFRATATRCWLPVRNGSLRQPMLGGACRASQWNEHVIFPTEGVQAQAQNVRSRTCASRAGSQGCLGCNAIGKYGSLVSESVVSVSAGEYHTCATKANGHLVCFGSNEHGQCNVPASLGPVLEVSAGGEHTCAVRADGELICFGSNRDGQCDVPADLGPVLAVAAGASHTCAVKSDGTLSCFGSSLYGKCTFPPDLGPVFAVSAGEHHTCVVRIGGQLVCFGSNTCGQCDVPLDLGPVSEVSAGHSHTCVRQANGQSAVLLRVQQQRAM